MGMTAEVVAKRYGVSREIQDELAFESQMRTAAAQKLVYMMMKLCPWKQRCFL